MKITVYNQQGKKAGSAEVSDTVFNTDWNGDLVHQVITSMRANARTPVAHTKERGEVRGGGKKPWPQKGTGQARHGSIRSPIWVGGGVAHGPRNERNYGKKINRKMRAKALYVVLSRKLAEGEMVFVDGISFDSPKTKEAKQVLERVSEASGAEDMVRRRQNAVLLVVPQKDEELERAYANLSNVAVAETRNLNAYDLLQYRYVVVVDPETSAQQLDGKLVKRAAQS